MLSGLGFFTYSSPEHLNSFKRLLGNGNDIGINIEYLVQNKPNG